MKYYYIKIPEGEEWVYKNDTIHTQWIKIKVEDEDGLDL